MDPKVKSPVRVAIETYIAAAEEQAKVGLPVVPKWVKDALIDVAQVATEQEFDRCVSRLESERPLLTNYNHWRKIIGSP